MPRFLLDKREVIPGGGFRNQAYYDYWGRWHLAIDYRAEFVRLYAWTKLRVTRQYWGNEGGNWLECEDGKGNKFRFAHLQEYKTGTGWVEEGTILGITGNSGAHTTGPHLHAEWYNNGVRSDIEIYFDNLLRPMSSYNDKIIRNESTGEYALVVRSKKFVIPKEPGTLALLTFLQREDKQVLTSEIINVTKAIWDSIPTSPDLSFS